MRNKRDGYSGKFKEILDTCKGGQDLIDKIIPTSTRNGAMMRSIPLCVLDDTYSILTLAKIQSEVTHLSIVWR